MLMGSVWERDRGSWEEEGRDGGGGGGEEEGSLGMVSSFGADSSLPFRPADPTRKVKHTMHYGGVNKKGVPKKRERKKNEKSQKLSKECFFFSISELCFSFFAKPPRQSAHAFVISTFLVSHSLEEKKDKKTIDTAPLRQISLAWNSAELSLSCRQSGRMQTG